MIHNNEIVEKFENNGLPTMYTMLRSLDEQIADLTAARQSLEYEILTLERVDEIYNGVALSICDFGGYSINAVDYKLTPRSAHVYKNAQNKRTWGLRTYDNNYGRRGEKWFGANWKIKKEVMKAAKDWIVSGTVPEEKT